MDLIAILILLVLAFAAGHFHGYALGMRYCAKRLQELRT